MAQLGAIGIVTADIAEAVRFYRLIGVDAPEPGGDDDHFEATLANGLRLMWDTESLIRQLYPEWQRPTSGPAVSLAFECANAQDVDDCR